MTRRHTTTLFRLNNLRSLEFPFKLMKIELQEIEHDPALNNRNMQKILMKLSSVTSGPVAPFFKNGEKYIAVKANSKIESVEINLAPMIAKAVLLHEEYDLNFDSITNENRELALRFLEFSIKEHLGNHPKIWRYNSNQYFLRKPLFFEPHSSIDVFSGFNFKLVHQPDGHYYIALDLSYKYIDKKFLHEYLEGDNIDVIKKRLKGRKCLYFGGDSWYQVQIAGFGKSIKDHEFPEPNGRKHTVMNWALNNTKSETFNMKSHLFPEAPALIMNYPGNTSKYFNGATCLAKLLYNTSDDFVNGMHSKTIQSPKERFYFLKSFIKHNFKGIIFNGKELQINQHPLSENLKLFPLPELKFNNGIESKALEIDEKYERYIEDFGKMRRINIVKNGILNRTTFMPQYILIPDSVNFSLAKAIQFNLTVEMKRLASSFDEFILVIYKDLKSTSAYKQFKEIKAALESHNATHGNAIFLLPESQEFSGKYIEYLHDCVKKALYKNFKFQCASVKNISSFYRPFTDKEGIKYMLKQEELRQYRSYTSYLLFEFLIVNQKWPYALKNPLKNDIYIGLDVHDHYAGFVFFYGNGEKIVFDYAEVSNRTGTFRNEKISAKIIVEKLLENLKRHIPLYAINPNSVVLIRDGRSFGEEGKALKIVLDHLADEGLVKKETIKWAIVDIHKNTTIPYRIAKENGGYYNLTNPITGTYKIFDEKSGFLFTTGYPFKISGTVQPLYVNVVEGNIELESVLQDVFHQCILAFSAPDKGSSLPIVIKLIDTMIRSFAHQVTEKALEEQEELVSV